MPTLLRRTIYLIKLVFLVGAKYCEFFYPHFIIILLKSTEDLPDHEQVFSMVQILANFVINFVYASKMYRQVHINWFKIYKFLWMFDLFLEWFLPYFLINFEINTKEVRYNRYIWYFWIWLLWFSCQFNYLLFKTNMMCPRSGGLGHNFSSGLL